MRRFLAVTLLVLCTFLSSLVVFAYDNIPDKVKIGLYYGTSGASVVKIGAQNGMIFGVNNSDGFTKVYDSDSTTAVTVRKDSYYTKNNGQLVEVKASSSNSGTVLGPYHIQIGDSYNTREEASAEIEKMKTSDICTYPDFDGQWHVWYGMFRDSTSASNSINAILKPALGDKTFEIIEPSAQRVAVESGDDVIMMIGKESQFLGIRPKEGNSTSLINIGGKNYRGEVEIRRYSSSDMTVINILPLEEYLYGVVPREIGASSPIEAIKAQAILARNYAVNNLKKNSKWGFDLTNTVSDQAYGGYDWEKPTSNGGVDETKGKLLMYDNKPAEAFYFSTSGGRTEDVKNVWNSKASYPYLVSVEDKYEPADATKAKWEVTLTSSQIKQSLSSQGIDLGDITSVQPLEFSEAGRVIKLLIVGTKGQKTFEKQACRTALGKDILSQWYTVSTGADIFAINVEGTKTKVNASSAKVISAGGTTSISTGAANVFVKGADGIQSFSTASSGFKFSGRGWGHGIGMSQVGAIGMANAGFTYDKILEWYFKGTYIE